jgi:hypothetical protein
MKILGMLPIANMYFGNMEDWAKATVGLCPAVVFWQLGHDTLHQTICTLVFCLLGYKI